MNKSAIISMMMSLCLSLSCNPSTKQTLVESDKFSESGFTEVKPGASRDVVNDEDKTCSPYFLIKSNDISGSWLPLQSTRADVKITGAIANVKVQQVYVNEGKQTLDAVYVFPGSTRAAVYGLDMTIGKRTIHAKVMEKEEARRGFDQAKNDGKRATLLEQDRPNVFRMEVANILPGDTIKVDMFYTELVEYKNKEYEFIYPTAVGPRYSTGNEAFVNQSITQLKSDHQPQFDIFVTIDGAIPVQMVESSTYPLKVKHESPTSTLVTLSNPKGSVPDKDFILYYSLQGGQVESGLTLYEHGDEKFFLFMMQPPKKITTQEILPREYIFIIDVSGSMSGYPLEVSKTILKNLISSLKPTDRFNVLLFESSNSMLSKKSLPATPANIQKAIRVIDEQEGGGGTELYPALKTAFEYKDPQLENYARTFIIATDGFVSVENEAFKLIANNLSSASFVPLGIGEGVNRYLIEGMAWAGASEPFIIENQTKAEEVGRHLISTISQPLLSDINIDWGNLQPYDIYPEKVPNIFSERPIVVFGKYKGSATGNITIKGKTAGGNFEQRLTADKISKSDNQALRYLWARNKVKYLSDYASCFDSYTSGYYSDDKYKKEITDLGLKYNLLTKYTSFLAVDNEKIGDLIVEERPMEVNYSDNKMVSYEATAFCSKSVDCLEMAPLSSVICADKEQEEPTEVFESVETSPQYPGGQTAMMEFIASNLKYPEASQDASIQGRVILKFIVDVNGNITDIEVLRSLDPACDKEAIRVLKLMPKWIPGKMNGKAVAVYFTLPVTFKLSVE